MVLAGSRLLALAKVASAEMLAGALVKMPTDHQVHFEDLQEVAVPEPSSVGGSEVRIQVAGSSVNPVDWKLIESDYVKAWSYPHVFGRDCAGTVLEVGADVRRLKVGDKVWADNAQPEGCYAEYALLDEAITGLAPSTISLAEAAVLPLVALTAKQGLEYSGLPNRRLDTIVVLGGSGGVGHVGVQIARAWAPDAQIYTTCGTRNQDFCRQMGADHVIDYHEQEWQDVVPALSADIIFDTVAIAGTGELAYKVLKDGGNYVTLLSSSLASDATAKSRPSVSQNFFLTNSSDYRQLDTLKDLVDAGKVSPVVDRTFTTKEIAECFNYSMAGHTVGKTSMVPSTRAIVV